MVTSATRSAWYLANGCLKSLDACSATTLSVVVAQRAGYAHALNALLSLQGWHVVGGARIGSRILSLHVTNWQLAHYTLPVSIGRGAKWEVENGTGEGPYQQPIIVCSLSPGPAASCGSLL